MVREDEPIEPAGSEAAEVRRGHGAQAGLESAAVLSSAYQMPVEAARHVLPASLFDSPAIDMFLATHEGRCVGSVTATHHGDTLGIWAMGTDASNQRKGIGRRLLSTALSELRVQGARRFFLGATPAGYQLYESLGFVTQVTTQVWASGETHQA